MATKVCDHCGNTSGSSPDRAKILFNQGSRKAILQLTVPSGETSELFWGEDGIPYDARFAPDGRWIAFHLALGPGRRQVFITPYRDGEFVEEGEWIRITESPGSDSRPDWSPDGSLLYFLSDRDGFSCIWAQRLDTTTSALPDRRSACSTLT